MSIWIIFFIFIYIITWSVECNWLITQNLLWSCSNRNNGTLWGDPLHSMPESLTSSFFASPASSVEVIRLVLGMKNSNCNLYNIPSFIYKKLVNLLALLIANIFKDSISTGIFPNCSKFSTIIPIFKSKNTKFKGNYWPLSTMCVMSKIMEKLMSVRVISYVTKDDILFHNQFGFRPGKSTGDANLRMVDECSDALDSKKFLVALLLDFS